MHTGGNFLALFDYLEFMRRFKEARIFLPFKGNHIPFLTGR